MKRTLLILLTIAVAVALGFSQGKVTRQKTTNTEQTQQTSDKPKRTQQSADKPKQRQTTSTPKYTAPVKVSEPDGTINGYGYVDLGLPSGKKWATCNLGASSPTADGDRYARGEVKPKKSFTAENYEFVRIDEKGVQVFGKYPSPYRDDLDLEHDAAHLSMGATWKIPSKEDWKELGDNCNAEGVVYKGKKGMLLTSKNNGKSIFLPLTPQMFPDGTTAKNSGDYWSSSTGGNSGALAFNFSFLKTYKLGGCSSANPIQGRVIRPVSD